MIVVNRRSFSVPADAAAAAADADDENNTSPEKMS